jgi:hypothetical protein
VCSCRGLICDNDCRKIITKEQKTTADIFDKACLVDVANYNGHGFCTKPFLTDVSVGFKGIVSRDFAFFDLIG